jgi:hypothetical protein
MTLFDRPLMAMFCRFLLLTSVALACQPEIGDACSNASDCSVQDQRTCDTTYPGGYCTILGCGADACPSEAVCVGFQSVLSVAPECASLQSRPRLQRTVCLRSCSDDTDCRGEYRCVDMSLPNPWGAVVVDRGGVGKVCALPPPPDPVGATGVCSSAVPVPIPVPDGGSGSDASAP